MKAAYYEGNKTFRVADAPAIPPAPGEVRLKVAYVGICGTDVHIYHGHMDQRVKIPQIIGHEMSGTIAEVGPGVTGFAVGDSVVVRPLDNRAETPADRGNSHICRNLKFIGIDSPGGFQTYWNVPAFAVHKAPPATDLKLAALAEPLAVACHDVRLGGVKPGELAVVIGGGPIGILVALVARAAGAQVIISEVNELRLAFARSLGFEAHSPLATDLPALCREKSGDAGADIVFEVSGAKSAAATMTDLLAIRGRIVVVAIYPKPVEINLHQFFWKELKLIGARVYEREDYEKALALIASRELPLEKLVTRVEPLTRIQAAFDNLGSTPDAMKILIDCQA
ncbi:theronine dehydrogenase-like Zn-dependent dehydrogenase [Opitutaceae bacterium TAV1]|nr:molecular chaperone GroES [Opitutaceae bacterium TAV5]EIQ01802.1 theronine dehydrogenase-like Zn-dependent dehydrogenase [Opitutaceae bacterium TAV1]